MSYSGFGANNAEYLGDIPPGKSNEMNDLKEILKQVSVNQDVAEFIADLKRTEESLAAMLAEYESSWPVDDRHMFMAKQHFEIGYILAVKAIINNKSNDIWGIEGA